MTQRLNQALKLALKQALKQALIYVCLAYGDCGVVVKGCRKTCCWKACRWLFIESCFWGMSFGPAET